jgi:hypothetical protein
MVLLELLATSRSALVICGTAKHKNVDRESRKHVEGRRVPGSSRRLLGRFI